MITDEQLDDMLHALGKSHTPKRSKMGWRNYYTSDAKGSESWDDLVSKGLATRNDANAGRSNQVVYRVSEQGLKLLGVKIK